MGFTQSTVNFLIVVGTASIFAAGWFYSVFTTSRNMESEDALSFLIKRILTFGSAQFKEGYMLINLLVFTFIWLSLLALIGLITWICRKIIEKSGAPRSRTETDLSFSFNEEGSFATARIRSRSVFSMWMELLPILFAVGIGFILLSLFGTTQTNLDVLFKSLSGQMVGTLIAFVVTGVIILYITLIIEPRLYHNSQQEKLAKPIWKTNWELSSIIVLFLVLMAGVVIYSFIVQPDYAASNADPQQTNSSSSRMDPGVALVSFIITVLFTGFTLGHGIRYRGMYREKERIENSIKNLSLAIEQNSRPRFFDMQSIETGGFREKFEKCQSDFFDIVTRRNEQVKELIDDRTTKTVRVRWRDRWRRVWSRQDKNEIVLETRELTSVEEKYFPHYKREIEDLKSNLWQKRSELEETKALIKEIESRRSELENMIKRNIQNWETKLLNYRRDKLKWEKKWHTYRNNVLLEQQINESSLKDGFTLGMWYGNNGFGFLGAQSKSGRKS